MAQKINPLSFRSKQDNFSSNSNWFIPINNFNYQILLHQDFEVRKFIVDFFNFKKIYIHKIILNKYDTNLDIHIQIYKEKSQHLTKSDLKFLIFIIKKNLKLNFHTKLTLNIKNLQNKKKFRLKNKILRQIKFKLYRYKNIKNLDSILELMLIIFTFKSSEILLKYITNKLKKSIKKKQFRDIFFLKNILREFFNYYNNNLKLIDGLKIQIKGRLNGSKRSKISILQFGNTPLQTLNVSVNYSFDNFVNKDGLFGAKVLFFKK